MPAECPTPYLRIGVTEPRKLGKPKVCLSLISEEQTHMASKLVLNRDEAIWSFYLFLLVRISSRFAADTTPWFVGASPELARML